MRVAPFHEEPWIDITLQDVDTFSYPMLSLQVENFSHGKPKMEFVRESVQNIVTKRRMESKPDTFQARPDYA